MKVTMGQALTKLSPEADWKIVEGTLYWLDENFIQPTEEQIQAKIAELQAAEPLRLLREERDRRLATTDWRATIDYPGDDQATWLEYRQALRDITNTYTSLDDVVWPEEPV